MAARVRYLKKITLERWNSGALGVMCDIMHPHAYASSGERRYDGSGWWMFF